MDEILDKDRPFQLWTHFQDEPAGIFEGFETREVAEARGCEYSLKPIIYGTVTLRNEDGQILSEFEHGKVSKRWSWTPGTRLKQDMLNIPLLDLGNLLNLKGFLKWDDKNNKWVEARSNSIVNTTSRPSWDAYFISEAFRVSRRSLDKHTKCGAVLVLDKRIVSTGYNSPPPGFDDANADLERPGKYIIMEHAERNSICNAARSGSRTLGTTCYVTGFPCSDCYRAMWNAGIIEVIYAPISLEYFTEDHIARLPAARNGPKLTLFPKERMGEVIKILDDEYDYIMDKVFGEINTPVSAPTP